MRVVLFDLDGTLSDSARGILASLRKTFAELGVPWIPDAEARSLLGPPFSRSLPRLIGAARVPEATDIYRRHYVTGGDMYDTSVYAGLADVLPALVGHGLRLAVATSKPEPHAVQIVEHLGLARYFDTICGDTVDGRRDSKSLVVGEALRRMSHPDPSTVLMVGDRSHDVLGAAAHGVGCAGVLWGYGSAAELQASGALRLYEHPAQLLELIGPAL